MPGIDERCAREAVDNKTVSIEWLRKQGDVDFKEIEINDSAVDTCVQFMASLIGSEIGMKRKEFTSRAMSEMY